MGFDNIKASIQFINNIIIPIMEQELTSPLIFRVKKARAHSRDKRTSFEIPRRQSIRIKESQIES